MDLDSLASVALVTYLVRTLFPFFLFIIIFLAFLVFLIYSLLKRSFIKNNLTYLFKVSLFSVTCLLLSGNFSSISAYNWSINSMKHLAYNVLGNIAGILFIIMFTFLIMFVSLFSFFPKLILTLQKSIDFFENACKIDVREAMMRLNMDFRIWLSDFFVRYGMKVFVSFLIIAVGIFLLRKTNKVLSIFWKKSNIDSSLTSLVNYSVKFILYAVIILSVLKQFGSIWDIIAPLSASILAISVLFKENISNFVSGIFIILYQPIHVGDYISVSSFSGTVLQIGHSFTYLHTTDNKCIVVPNTKIMSEILTRKSKWNITPVVMNLKISMKDENSELSENEKLLRHIKNTLEEGILFYSKDTMGIPSPKLEFLSTDKFPIDARFTVWVNGKVDNKVMKSMRNLIKNKLSEFLFDISFQQNVESTV